MALTITPVKGASFTDGNKRRKVCDVTFDNSYAAAGEPLVPASVGLRVITEAIPHGLFRKSDGSAAVGVSYDYTNKVLVAFDQKDPAATGGADVPFPKVISTFDLSTYSGRITFLGY